MFETGWITPLAHLLADILTLEVRTSFLALLLAAIALGCGVWRFAHWKLAPEQVSPTKNDYTRDLIVNVIWEWGWEFGEPVGLTAICPRCGAEMDEERRPVMSARRIEPSTAFDNFTCRPCGDAWEFEGGNPRGSVKREIERRRRTGEWREAVAEYGSRSEPIDVPIET